MLLMLRIIMANFVCHTSYSVMDSFFPQDAQAKGLSLDTIGAVFMAFPLVVICSSPMVGPLMCRHGVPVVYVSGLAILAAATFAFAFCVHLPDGLPFAAGCVALRLVQGLGSALEEAAAYALIVSIAHEHVSLFLGVTEISTGMGYLVGPPMGGLLYSAASFPAPFLAIAILLACVALWVGTALLGPLTTRPARVRPRVELTDARDLRARERSDRSQSARSQSARSQSARSQSARSSALPLTEGADESEESDRRSLFSATAVLPNVRSMRNASAKRNGVRIISAPSRSGAEGRRRTDGLACAGGAAEEAGGARRRGGRSAKSSADGAAIARHREGGQPPPLTFYKLLQYRQERTPFSHMSHPIPPISHRCNSSSSLSSGCSRLCGVRRGLSCRCLPRAGARRPRPLPGLCADTSRDRTPLLPLIARLHLRVSRCGCVNTTKKSRPITRHVPRPHTCPNSEWIRHTHR